MGWDTLFAVEACAPIECMERTFRSVPKRPNSKKTTPKTGVRTARDAAPRTAAGREVSNPNGARTAKSATKRNVALEEPAVGSTAAGSLAMKNGNGHHVAPIATPNGKAKKHEEPAVETRSRGERKVVPGGGSAVHDVAPDKLVTISPSTPARLSHGPLTKFFRKVWSGAELDAALEQAGGDAAAFDRLIDQLNRENIEISLGFEDPPEAPRPASNWRGKERGEEISDPLSILFSEAQRRPRPTRDEERRLYRRVAFTKRRLDRTLSELNYSKDVVDSFLKTAPCLSFKPAPGGPNGASCSNDDEAPCVRFSGLCSAEVVHERCCSFHAARNAFVVRYLYLVLGMVRRYRDRGIDAADLVQEGSAALMRASDDFEPERGFRFSTYARWWVNQAFLRTMYNNLRTVRLPVYLQKAAAKVMRHAGDRDFREADFERLSKLSGVSESTIRILAEFSRSTVSLDAVAGDREQAMSIADSRSSFKPEKIEKPDVKNEIEKAMSILDHRERTILKLRFGLESTLPKTLEDVGEVLNLSRERVRQIQEEALLKLRNPLHLERLRDLLDVD